MKGGGMNFFGYTLDDYLKANPPKWWQIKRRLGIISLSEFMKWASDQVQKDLQKGLEAHMKGGDDETRV